MWQDLTQTIISQQVFEKTAKIVTTNNKLLKNDINMKK